ncbi:CHAT domain-containing tetratricopeptide repeat protein [Frankia gtarii]|uniref:CHAT domain-containing tetratricopeptide repeat protein n=1 Tax=Frankia gtarii TaxID=2950102 RepID=UPI0021C09E77|nr:CHAT domain-containing protein [Frankia gtarii]
MRPGQFRESQFGPLPYFRRRDLAVALDAKAAAELRALLGAVTASASDIEMFHSAGWLHWERYLARDACDDRDDLAAALGCFAPVYQQCPDAVPLQARVLLNESANASPSVSTERAHHANALLRTAVNTGDHAALDTAIGLLRPALSSMPPGHLNRSAMLSNLCGALQVRFKQTGALAELDEAVEVGLQAVAATEPGHPDHATALRNLGSALQTRFLRTGRPADLEAAVNAARQALATAAPDHAHRASMLSDLSSSLRIRFEVEGSPADLSAAVKAGRQAKAATAPDHADYASHLSDLGVVLRIRFERTGKKADLNDAIKFARQAAAITPGRSDQAPTLCNLGTSLRIRFEATGSRADLDEAVKVGRQAVVATAPTDPNYATALSDLSGTLRVRFETGGVLADLNAAVGFAQQAVDITPPDSPNRPLHLSNLSSALKTKFEQTGIMADLDAAVDAAQLSVAPAAKFFGRAGAQSNLGTALQTRFMQTGELADLDAAVEAAWQAVADTAREHPNHAMYLANLGSILRVRYERTGAPADLDAAVEAGRQAVSVTPADHPNRGGYLTSLGAILRIRADRTGQLSDLDAAIGAMQWGTAATAPDNPHRGDHLGTLSGALQARFAMSGKPADLAAAIETGKQAIAATTPDQPNRAIYLANLSSAMRIRFEQTGTAADLDAAIENGRDGAGMEMAAPRVRAMAARRWGKAAGLGRLWNEAARAFEAAVELVGKVAPRGLARPDQEYLLSELGGLASDAAACCVRQGRTAQAVELLEQGRGVLLGQTLDIRTDVTALASAHPDLAQRFLSLSERLDDDARVTRSLDSMGPVAVPSPPALGGSPAGKGPRRILVEEFEAVVTQIRTLPGFAGFRRPPTIEQLLVAAEQGPVVMVAVSSFGSQALLLTSSGVDVAPLPALTPTAVFEQVAIFLDAVGLATAVGARSLDEKRLDDVLVWLWNALAAPILNRMGIVGPPGKGDEWPRMWWCVSGLLSFLPIHAAGLHRTRHHSCPETVVDRVVSSYTPTVRALLYARRSNAAYPGNGRILAVGMPHTPDMGDLPGAQTETDALKRRFADRTVVLAPPESTREAVIKALPETRWAHFACHGTAEISKPSASRLVLHDGPLTVEDLIELRLEGAELAFLSACETARPGALLTDEALHLASAFQLAGFRHVIATLWPISDGVAVDLADQIYAALAAGGDPAGAVHQATRELRDYLPRQPALWASQIHAGA